MASFPSSSPGGRHPPRPSRTLRFIGGSSASIQPRPGYDSLLRPELRLLPIPLAVVHLDRAHPERPRLHRLRRRPAHPRPARPTPAADSGTPTRMIQASLITVPRLGSPSSPPHLITILERTKGPPLNLRHLSDDPTYERPRTPRRSSSVKKIRAPPIAVVDPVIPPPRNDDTQRPSHAPTMLGRHQM